MIEYRGFCDENKWGSNFEGGQISFEGITYGSVEAAYQAAKIGGSNYTDQNEINRMRKDYKFHELSPWKAKKMGKLVPLRPDWEQIKNSIMLTLLREKFKNNQVCRDWLLSRADEELVEFNTWHDNYWGVCTCGRQRCVEAFISYKNNEQHNNLGQLLRQVRREIRQSKT